MFIFVVRQFVAEGIVDVQAVHIVTVDIDNSVVRLKLKFYLL